MVKKLYVLSVLLIGVLLLNGCNIPEYDPNTPWPERPETTDQADRIWTDESPKITYNIDVIESYSSASITYNLGECSALILSYNSSYSHVEVGVVFDAYTSDNSSSTNPESMSDKAIMVPFEDEYKTKLDLPDLIKNQKYKYTIYCLNNNSGKIKYLETKYFFSKNSNYNDDDYVDNSSVQTLSEVNDDIYSLRTIYGRLKNLDLYSEYGFCYLKNLETDPNINNSTRVKSINIAIDGTFEYSINNSRINDEFYYCAYAVDLSGKIHYGATRKFHIDASDNKIVFNDRVGVDILDFNKVRASVDILENSPIPEITEKGFCYLVSGTSSSKITPTTSNIKAPVLNDITSTCNADITIELLPSKQGYYLYIRPYAITSYSTYYGKVIERRISLSDFDVTNSLVMSNISSNSATANLMIGSYKPTLITEVGVCWVAGNSTPTINNTKQSKMVGSTTNSYNATINITSLPSRQTIRIRSYSVSIIGVRYSETTTIATL